MPFSIIVSGATGRVGSALCARIQADKTLRIAGALASENATGKPLAHAPDVLLNKKASAPVHAVIDFSTDEGCRGAIDAAREHNAALVVATTALSSETTARLDEAQRHIPLIVASNTSLGAALTALLAARATSALGSTYDVSIVEAHRKNKRDAPSGTALTIANAMRAEGAIVDDDQILSVRGGDTVGEHTVRLSGAGEVIEITHRVHTRDVFALGAIRAAQWLRGKPAGAYQITDVLGL